MTRRILSLSPPLCLLIASCGGRLDIAEVDRDDATEAALQGRVSDAPAGEPAPFSEPEDLTPDPSPNGALGLAPVDVAQGAQGAQEPAQDLIVDEDSVVQVIDRSGCFDEELDPFWAPEPQGGMVLFPVPSGGCQYSVVGDDDDCTATWTCCGVEYVVSFWRTEDAPTRVNTSWTFPPIIAYPNGLAESGPDEGQTCPLFGLEAPSIAARGYSYTPAWEIAVRNGLGETKDAPELDPIPLGCAYVRVGDCSARLECPEHTYGAGFDEDGEVECSRDDVQLAPLTEREQGRECFEPGLPSLVPANHCFGEGWSEYFQIAAEAPSTP